MDDATALPTGVRAVLKELIDCYRQTDHESGAAAVTWKREVAVPAIRRAIADAADSGALTVPTDEAEAEAVAEFDRVLGFRKYRIKARASTSRTQRLSITRDNST